MSHSSKHLQLPEFWEPEDACSQSETHTSPWKRLLTESWLAVACVAVQCMLGKLTETCPVRTLGLMGDVTEMDGPTFWESKEAEPEQNVENKTGKRSIQLHFYLLSLHFVFIILLLDVFVLSAWMVLSCFSMMFQVWTDSESWTDMFKCVSV